jgi:hypothetical protein
MSLPFVLLLEHLRSGERKLLLTEISSKLVLSVHWKLVSDLSIRFLFKSIELLRDGGKKLKMNSNTELKGQK